MIKPHPAIVLVSALVFILGVVYLALPSPATPDLAGDLQSDEPGDTWQNPDQKAFFTDKMRFQVLGELQSKFSVKLGGFTLPSYRLNYRPEEVGTLVRDQLQSYYLEEIIYPWRESLFVSGWEPQNTPMYAAFPRKDRPRVIINEREYLAKITLRPVRSGFFGRLLAWSLVFPSLYLLYLSGRYARQNFS